MAEEKAGFEQTIAEFKDLMAGTAVLAMEMLRSYAKLFGENLENFPTMRFAVGRADDVSLVSWVAGKGILVAEGFGGDNLQSAFGDETGYFLAGGYEKDRLYWVVFSPEGLFLRPVHMAALEPNLAEGVIEADSELILTLWLTIIRSLKSEHERIQR